MSSVDYNMLISTLESTVVTEYVKEDTQCILIKVKQI